MADTPRWDSICMRLGSTTYDGDGTVVAAPGSVGAANMFNWVNTYLDNSRTGSGLYWNAVRRDTSIDTNFWSYNQGVMIAANVLRYRLTSNTLYLKQAQSIATKTLSAYGNFTGQPPSFNAMCFEAMLLLASASSDGTLKANISQTIQAYGDGPGTIRPRAIRGPTCSISRTRARLPVAAVKPHSSAIRAR